jgi:hypothetical protein
MEKLTMSERMVLSTIAERVIEVMRWEKDEKEYHDNGDFLLVLNKGEMQALKTAAKKL